MLPVALLLLPVIGSVVLGSLYAPAVQAAINPGNSIMIASDDTFQSDTFSLAGSIGSLLPTANATQPEIVTGKWGLDVESGAVTGFSANLTMVNANGTGYRVVQLTNLTANVTMNAEGIATVKGFLDVTVNDAEKLSGIDAKLSIAKLRAVTLTIDSKNATTLFGGHSLYGIAEDPQDETVTASEMTPQPNGSGLFGNITNKFKLPQLPNPFQ